MGYDVDVFGDLVWLETCPLKLRRSTYMIVKTVKIMMERDWSVATSVC